MHNMSEKRTLLYISKFNQFKKYHMGLQYTSIIVETEEKTKHCVRFMSLEEMTKKRRKTYS